MYDAGGISLKPSDAMHFAMKQDMSGAAAVLGSMITLRALGCPTMVTGYLMCTDNMPSGKAMRLGDVLTIRGGMTVEVVQHRRRRPAGHGRRPRPRHRARSAARRDRDDRDPDRGGDADLRVGARAPTLGNHPDLVDQLEAAGARTDEPVWELPLVKAYRRKLDSAIADIQNLGGENAGTITAGLFLEEFTADVPFGHLDICGPMMTDTDDSLALDRRHGLRDAPPQRPRDAVQAAQGLKARTASREHTQMTEATAPQHTFLGRMLDTIERVGNKVPHPAIIFIILIVGVIVLSQILFFVGRQRHLRRRRAAARRGRGRLPVRQLGGGPAGPARGRGPGTSHRDGDDGGQGPAHRRRHPLHDHVAGRQLQQLRGRRHHPGGHARASGWPRNPG